MHIKNIALIDEIDISFEENLNILTGETGAGKSIIIGSLGIGTGGKIPKDILRDETKDGLVELIFSLEGREDIKKELENLEIEQSDEDEILISRRLSLSSNGSIRAINRINDTTVTAGKLKDVANLLIDLHAQHEQQTLLKADKHLAILDQFGKEECTKIKEQVQACYHTYMELKREYEASAMDEAEKNKRMDFLQYQISEIQNANLKVGEDEELEKQYKKAVNGKRIVSGVGEICAMTGDGASSQSSAAELVGHALQQLGKLTDLDSDLSSSYDLLSEIDSLLFDFNRDMNEYMRDMEFDEESFAEIEARLDVIHSLKSKYGSRSGASKSSSSAGNSVIEEILKVCEEYQEEFDKLSDYEVYISDLKKQVDMKFAELENVAKKLSILRKKNAKRLCELIKDSLSELNFMTVEFDMKFEETEHITANGMDIAYFMISTNIGEPLRPLYDVASGGELSRVMLAIKSCLAYEDDTPSLVFDEIDVGISGRTAQKVAEKMSVIGKTHQVICITHLPQIAAMADSHYIIEKNVSNNKTISEIRKLSKDEEIEEIARMLGGAEITQMTMDSAKEMKALAKRVN